MIPLVTIMIATFLASLISVIGIITLALKDQLLDRIVMIFFFFVCG